MEDDGYKRREGRCRHQCKTRKKKDTRDPQWKANFVMRSMELQHTLLRLTVWDHDFGMGNDDFLGFVQVDLRRQTLPLEVVDMPLEGNGSTTAEGTISFSLSWKAQTGMMKRPLGGRVGRVGGTPQ